MPPLDEISVQTFNDIISAGVSSKLVYEGSVCDAYPCWNDGVCVESNLTDTGYFCMCNKFFSGDHCDVQVFNNCSNIVCPPRAVCFSSTSLCAPIRAAKTFPRCIFEPCRNGGSCVMFENESPYCICPPNFHGLLCEYSHRASSEVPMNWNVLQLLILFGVMFLLASAFLTLCYNGNYSCYLNWKRRYKYDKWSIESDFQWYESDEEEDQDLINGGSIYHPGHNLSATDTSKNCFELKNKPMRVSTTAESFVTYSGSSGANSDSNHSANPVDLSQ
uniref:EGF-like domain-containing protein n=2 Tax=Bursaphelenchus xylophilus TaxID=6326 RepID=A0A1I7SMM4_BURXY